jgi:hypothetical protein
MRFKEDHNMTVKGNNILSLKAGEVLVAVESKFKTRCVNIRKKTQKIINSVKMQALLFFFTFYALVGEDLRLLLLSKPVD